ncbi:MAG: hypothetical protein VBE63_12035 [Lamprobacter sp.]|uniref:hypothetical protein n=1 Tax=Lamprobacter sp. TaxID=3100796 RepID=UPI002B25E326|nr:hypothetical protein [Lamprobacter sp.]MEA3640657.1 hypothetical protein [Lamprobacter sp.]
MDLTLAPNPLHNEQQTLSFDKISINPLVNGSDGLCPEKLQAYIDLIPPQEISEDINNMYNFIVRKLN